MIISLFLHFWLCFRLQNLYSTSVHVKIFSLTFMLILLFTHHSFTISKFVVFQCCIRDFEGNLWEFRSEIRTEFVNLKNKQNKLFDFFSFF